MVWANCQHPITVPIFLRFPSSHQELWAEHYNSYLPDSIAPGRNICICNVSAESVRLTIHITDTLTYSVHDPSEEVLYMPTSDAVKFKAKFWIDVVGQRITKAIGSVRLTIMPVVWMVFSSMEVCLAS